MSPFPFSRQPPRLWLLILPLAALVVSSTLQAERHAPWPQRYFLTGELQLTVSAGPAWVQINGYPVAQAMPGQPLLLAGLPVGEIDLRLDAEGHVPHHEKLQIGLGERKALHVQLTPEAGEPADGITRESPQDRSPVPSETAAQATAIDETGATAAELANGKRDGSTTRLTVRSNVYRDQVYLDGEPLGSTRLDLDLIPGRYGLRVEKEGYTAWEKVIELGSAPLILHARLEPVEELDHATLIADALEPEMLQVPAGCFRMGSPQQQVGRQDNETRHSVCVNAFMIGKYEVTQRQWRLLMDANPSRFRLGPNHPVESVSWHEVQLYIQRLNERTGKRYRLPTEAEWEYAARAGSDDAYWWGAEPSRDFANYGADKCCDPARGGADRWLHHAPVGSFPPNPWGLHDTVGNVWEWTCSEYRESYQGYEKTCSNKADGLRASRGGSWLNEPAWVRSAARDGTSVLARVDELGLRLARDNFQPRNDDGKELPDSAPPRDSVQ